MHEAALASSIVDLVQEQARAQGFTRVREIRLAVGALASVEVEALRFGLDVACQGTVAQGATVLIETPPGRAHCMACDADVELASRADLCPRCQSGQLLVTQGEELKVVDLLVD